jgi:hypothetical protein
VAPSVIPILGPMPVRSFLSSFPVHLLGISASTVFRMCLVVLTVLGSSQCGSEWFWELLMENLRT